MNDDAGLAARRRFFAEEVQMTSNLKSPALVDALAIVPRERFLPAGPWTVRGEADFQSPLRQTADANPRHVYHNIAVGIDPSRMLFNGAPGLVSMAIDALAPKPGDRVLHLGTGLGYYTAILAHCVGPSGRVLGIEVDAELAASARANLADMSWAEVQHGNGTEPLDDRFDAILINAGVTHLQAAWLDALAPGGRMVLPITASMPSMATIGKGLLLVMTRTDDPAVFSARVATFVAIYSGVGLRDAAIDTEIGKALMKNPFPPIKTFRRDGHEPGPQCWLHTPGGCLSLQA
jgi:protein-L-isoaspartate(D-aspartate) O-methyltransferase